PTDQLSSSYESTHTPPTPSNRVTAVTKSLKGMDLPSPERHPDSTYASQTSESRASVAPPILPEEPEELSNEVLDSLNETLRDRDSISFHNISFERFERLEAVHKDLFESRKTSYEYDGTTKEMIIKLAPSPLHSTVQEFVTACVSDSRESVPSQVVRGLSTKTEHKVTGTTPSGAPYIKVPDQMIKPKQAKSFYPPVVIENGVSSTLVEMLRKAETYLWDTDFQINFVMIFNVVKYPRKIRPWEPSTADFADPATYSGLWPPDAVDLAKDHPVAHKKWKKYLEAFAPLDLVDLMLAKDKLDKLRKPLLGPIDAQFFVYCRDEDANKPRQIKRVFEATIEGQSSHASLSGSEFSLSVAELYRGEADLLRDKGISTSDAANMHIRFPMDQLYQELLCAYNEERMAVAHDDALKVFKHFSIPPTDHPAQRKRKEQPERSPDPDDESRSKRQTRSSRS
ncbi:MAG: hypothetical protein M1838_002048, partial [Thelocarpon superellum]